MSIGIVSGSERLLVLIGDTFERTKARAGLKEVRLSRRRNRWLTAIDMAKRPRKFGACDCPVADGAVSLNPSEDCPGFGPRFV